MWNDWQTSSSGGAFQRGITLLDNQRVTLTFPAPKCHTAIWGNDYLHREAANPLFSIHYPNLEVQGCTYYSLCQEGLFLPLSWLTSPRSGLSLWVT